MDEDFSAHLLEQFDYTPKVLLVLVSSSASGEGRRRPLVSIINIIITKVFLKRLDGGVYGGGGRDGGGKSGHV